MKDGLLEYINERIELLTANLEMKSTNECIQDEAIIYELKLVIGKINKLTETDEGKVAKAGDYIWLGSLSRVIRLEEGDRMNLMYNEWFATDEQIKEYTNKLK